MYIFLAIIFAIALPISFFLMSKPEIRRVAGTIKLDVFLGVMTKCLRHGDLDRARKMCSVTKNCLVAETVIALIDAKSKVEMDIAVERAKLSAQKELEAAMSFSVVQTVRNLIVLGVPFLIMYADGWKEGWVIAPLTISLMVSGVLVMWFRSNRATVVGYNLGLPEVLDEIYGQLLPLKHQQAEVGNQVTGALQDGNVSKAAHVLAEYFAAQLTK